MERSLNGGDESRPGPGRGPNLCKMLFFFRALEAIRAGIEDEFGAQGSHLGAAEASCARIPAALMMLSAMGAAWSRASLELDFPRVCEPVALDCEGAALEFPLFQGHFFANDRDSRGRTRLNPRIERRGRHGEPLHLQDHQPKREHGANSRIVPLTKGTDTRQIHVLANLKCPDAEELIARLGALWRQQKLPPLRPRKLRPRRPPRIPQPR